MHHRPLPAVAACVFLFGLAGRLEAQEVAGLAEARAVAGCLRTEHEAIQRLLGLIEQAEQRSRAAGVAEDVRRDAIASIEALIERVRQHAQQARTCVEATRIPSARAEARVEEGPADPAHESLASDRGTVHEVESGTRLGPEVRVIRGERVDGAGRAPDENVRAAMRRIGDRLARCYAQYLEHGARRSFEVHLSFSADSGGRVGRATVERGASDPRLRQCVERATEGMLISGQQGRSVYAYVIRLGE